MKTRLLPSLICWGLCLGAAQAADNGPRDHASGPYDPATGVYTVVAGDDAGPIAERFGLSLGQLEQLNGMVGAQIDVGQRLQVNETAVSVQVNMGPPAGGAANQAPSNQPAAVQSVPPDPWPREIQVGGRTLLVYQPQVVSWKDNQLDLRAAVAVKPQGKGDEAFGVVEAQARTQVDRVQRQVVLQDLKVTKAEFPSLPEMGSALSAKAAQQFANGIRVVPLDRLETALGVSQTTPPAGVQVQNPVPKVIVSTTPAVLVPIQGNPVLKSVAGTQFQRIVNTRAVILTAGANQPYYLHLLDGWVTAPSLTGPWTLAPIYPPELDEIASKLAAKGAVDLLNGNPSTPTLQILSAGIPTVYVSQTPTELIVFKGQPDLQPIAGTGLLWATNTSADVIVNTADNSYYALMAGRWYRAPSLQGTWAFVASTALPADFKKIPPSSPAGVVLASVAGTPQAKEATIANSIPQTATVPLKGGPTFRPSFDGPPTVSTLPGTDLEYVVNTETPILRVNGQTYYALQAGVWFESASLDGPWTVARSVPAAIYTIPPSSPLYYATYVKVYGATPEAVYEGYTPGYLGAETTDDGVVVYGTGYDYQPWVGDLWYAAPETFGLAAQPIYNPAAGYAFGFGLGLATAAAAEPYWGGAYYRPYYAGYGCCAVTSANVYSHWGDTVADGTRSWYAEDGRVGTAATGTYTNWRTGTTGSYEAGRSYNPYTGEAQRGYGRTFETARGTEGGVERGERYNPATGVTSYGSRMAASGPEGGAVSRDTERAEGPYGGSAAAHQTTVTNPHTGETHSWDTARVGDNVYAGSDGNVYRHTDNGWQSHSASGWGAVGGDTSWADREQAARTGSDARMDSGFGSADRFGGGGFGGFGNRFGGGGFGGGFGGRFGGGGFGGGRFGGFRR